MIVLEKKKIIYIMGIISMFVFTYIITGYNVNNSKKIKNESVEAVQTVALPVNNKVIILEAGHGVPDERCRK